MHRFRSCLYAWLGSSPRSPSGKTGCMGSAVFLPFRSYAYPSEISIPMAPPWPYRQTGGPTCGASNNNFLRDRDDTLASSLRKVGFPLPHCRRSFRDNSASGLCPCPSSHSAHSLQGSYQELSNYMLLGTPLGWLCTTIMAAALRRMAALKSSPTRTCEEFSDPR